MVTWQWSVDTLFWQLSINHNIGVEYQRCTYGNGADYYYFWAWRTDSHVTTEIFSIDGLPILNSIMLGLIWRRTAYFVQNIQNDTTIIRLFHKYYVKSSKYISGNAQKQFLNSLIFFLNISKNLLNISYFFHKNTPILNHLGQNFQQFYCSSRIWGRNSVTWTLPAPAILELLLYRF